MSTLRPSEIKTYGQMWSTWYGKILMGAAGTLGAFALLAVVVVIAGPEAETKAQSPAAALREADDVTAAACAPGGCTATVDFTAPGLGSARDQTVRATFPAMAAAWGAAPAPTSVRVSVESDTLSVGGKEGRATAMVVTCTAEQAAEINWDGVDADGIRKLCDVSERINFDG